MLNPFPDLLTYSFFAPTLLRAAVGIFFLYLAFNTFSNRHSLAHVRLPFIGAQSWVPTFAALAELLIAVMFLAGWYTQVAAIFGTLTALKFFVHRRLFSYTAPYFVYSSAAYALLLALCLSLLLTGAGALAFDLRL